MRLFCFFAYSCVFSLQASYNLLNLKQLPNQKDSRIDVKNFSRKCSVWLYLHACAGLSWTRDPQGLTYFSYWSYYWSDLYSDTKLCLFLLYTVRHHTTVLNVVISCQTGRQSEFYNSAQFSFAHKGQSERLTSGLHQAKGENCIN